MSTPPAAPTEPRGLHRGGRARGPARSTVVKVLSGLVSCAVFLYIGYLWHSVRQLNAVPRVDIAALAGPPAAPPGSASASPSTSDFDGKDHDILVVGNDDRSGLSDKDVARLHVGRDGGSLNTDSMLLIHVPANGERASLVSFPRDSYVNIPGYGMNKLNTAYGFGYNNSSGSRANRIAAGANLLIETIDKLTGLFIDSFVLVSLIGFVDISDVIGGVTVDMCKAVNDTVAYNLAHGRSGGSGLVLPAGKSKIQGVQALEFVRQREGLTLGDIDRTARQRYFLTAAFRKVASADLLLNPNKLSKLISAVNRTIYVDQNLNVLDLAKQLSNLSADNIVGEAIPFEGFEVVNGIGDVDVVDPAKVRAFVRKMVHGTPPSSKSTSSGSTTTPSHKTHKAVDAGCIN